MLQPGDRIGRFEIQRRLGRGGMATVYVAHDPNLGRLVALKMFEGDLDGGDAAEKFLREARAAAALNHPHIVTIHDFGEFASQPFIVMEYLQGDTLAALIKRKEPLSLAERLRLLEELCLGVAYAHGFDVIHRDIKPANLVRERTGRLKILDFGIARTLGSSMSRGTALVGTPGYMAPEQIHGGGIDRRADLFSIGVVAYELLSYAEAFSGDSLPAISHRVLHDEPVALSTLNPEIPAELVAIVEKALKKNPAERFADAAAMGAAVAQVRRQTAGDFRLDPQDTLVAPRPSPVDRGSGPGPAGSPGSGSGRGSSRPSGGPATPGPAARSGRDEIHRHRLAQIDAALGRAKVFMDEDRPDAALDACMIALALDENHVAALELEQRIRVALDRRQATALVAEARRELGHGQLTLAQQNLERARALDAEASEVRLLERDLRLARVEQEDVRRRVEAVRTMLESATADLRRGDLESALASARQAIRLDPASDLAREMEAEARRRLDVEHGVQPPTQSAPTVVVPQGRGISSAATKPSAGGGKSQSKAASGPSSVELAFQRTVKAVAEISNTLSQRGGAGWSAIRQSARQGMAAVAAGVRPSRVAKGKAMSARWPAWLPWALGGGVLVAALVAAVFMWPQPPPPPGPPKVGTVAIDATPWATVTAIVAQDGSPQTVPPDAVTPLSLQLPPGTYRVTLAGPLPGAPSQDVQVVVEEGQTFVALEVRFTPLTVDAYFESYLVSQPEEAQPGAPQAASVQPAGTEAR